MNKKDFIKGFEKSPYRDFDIEYIFKEDTLIARYLYCDINDYVELEYRNYETADDILKAAYDQLAKNSIQKIKLSKSFDLRKLEDLSSIFE